MGELLSKIIITRELNIVSHTRRMLGVDGEKFAGVFGYERLRDVDMAVLLGMERLADGYLRGIVAEEELRPRVQLVMPLEKLRARFPGLQAESDQELAARVGEGLMSSRIRQGMPDIYRVLKVARTMCRPVNVS